MAAGVRKRATEGRIRARVGTARGHPPTARTHSQEPGAARSGCEWFAHFVFKIFHSQKLMLNSLWGKLCQRPEQEEIRYTRTAREFHDLLADPKRHVMDFTHLNEELDRVQTRMRADFALAPPTNALQVACCVTAHARLHLWEYMEKIRMAGGEVIYCDTVGRSLQ